MYTDAINHDPAITFFQTGSQIAGRPSMGAWVHYGLGSDTQDLPAFVVLITPGKVDQPLYSRLWGSGFLPSQHQGVQFRSGKDAVLYLDQSGRRDAAEPAAAARSACAICTRTPPSNSATPTSTRASRSTRCRTGCRRACPGVMDVSSETEETFALYGPDAKKPGTFAANCLLARRLAERGVKFIQLYHQGWDQHDSLPKGIERAVPRDRSGQRRAGHRSEASRVARRHAGRVGRRVRPHELLAGQADGDQLRPRSSPALLLDLDGRRRREGRATSTARPTTSATTSSRAACTCTTSTRRCCSCSAWTTSG